jgi:hypothetical protein
MLPKADIATTPRDVSFTLKSKFSGQVKWLHAAWRETLYHV